MRLYSRWVCQQAQLASCFGGHLLPQVPSLVSAHVEEESTGYESLNVDHKSHKYVFPYVVLFTLSLFPR
jgi:hypothetical protein